jgi:hypothetical protein
VLLLPFKLGWNQLAAKLAILLKAPGSSIIWDSFKTVSKRFSVVVGSSARGLQEI